MCGTLRCGVLAIVSLSQCAISYGAPVPFLRASAGFWRPVHHDGCNVFLNTPDTHSIHQSYSAQGLSKTFHDVCVLPPATAQQDRHTRCLAFLVRGEKTAAALRTSAWHDTQHSLVSATTCSPSVTRMRGKESFETCRACLPLLKNTHAHTRDMLQWLFTHFNLERPPLIPDDCASDIVLMSSTSKSPPSLLGETTARLCVSGMLKDHGCFPTKCSVIRLDHGSQFKKDPKKCQTVKP